MNARKYLKLPFLTKHFKDVSLFTVNLLFPNLQKRKGKFFLSDKGPTKESHCDIKYIPRTQVQLTP